MTQRIGIFGGSFDPIHQGHLQLALAATAQAHLSLIFFLPTYSAPHKKAPQSSFSHRVKMCQLALEHYPHFRVSLLESTLPLPSYTIQTLENFQRQSEFWDVPTDWFLLLGSDQYRQFTTWKDYELILQKCQLLIYPRPGFPILERELQFGAIALKGELMDISSTEIRTSGQTQDFSSLKLPPEVVAYIRENNLYSHS